MAVAPRRVRLILEVVGDADPVRGFLSDDDGGHWDFDGWIDLAIAIEEAIRTGRPQKAAREETNLGRPQ